MTEDPNTYSAAGEVGQVRVRRTRGQRMWIAMKKAPISAWFGMIVIAFYAFAAIFGPFLAPYGEAEIFAKADEPWAMWGEILRISSALTKSAVTFSPG